MASSNPTFLYRGVHLGHPAMSECLAGFVRPSNAKSKLPPEQHALGNYSGNSPYTSWTHSFDTARFHAEKEGLGGVILKVPEGAPSASESWKWVHADIGWFEQEVLLYGARIGVEVMQRDGDSSEYL